MSEKFNLSSNDISNKVFKGASRGYDALEVDEFLDKIIQDYILLENNCFLLKGEKEKIESELKSLKEKNANLEIELSKLKNKYSNIKPTDNVNSDNISFIERINVLEAFLYKEGYQPKNIK